MASKASNYAYSVVTHNRFSVLERTGSAVADPKLSAKGQELKKFTQQPSAQKTVEKSVNKSAESKKLAHHSKASIEVKEIKTVERPSDKTRPVKTPKSDAAAAPRRDTGKKFVKPDVPSPDSGIRSDVKEDTRRRKDPRKDLGPKGAHRKDPLARVYDRGEHANVILGRGKRTEKRKGQGPHNWGGVMEAVEDSTVDPVVEYAGKEDTVYQKSMEVDATPISRPRRQDRRPQRERFDYKGDAQSESSERLQSKEEPEDKSISLDEYKASCEKLRLKPKKLQGKEEDATFRQLQNLTVSDEKKSEKKPKKNMIQLEALPTDMKVGARDRDRPFSSDGSSRGRGFSRGFRGGRRSYGSSGDSSIPHSEDGKDSMEFSSRGRHRYPERGGDDFGRYRRPKGEGRGGSAFRDRPVADSDSKSNGGESSGYQRGGGFGRRRGGPFRGGFSSRGSSRYDSEMKAKPAADVVLDISDFPSL